MKPSYTVSGALKKLRDMFRRHTPTIQEAMRNGDWVSVYPTPHVDMTRLAKTRADIPAVGMIALRIVTDADGVDTVEVRPFLAGDDETGWTLYVPTTRIVDRLVDVYDTYGQIEDSEYISLRGHYEQLLDEMNSLLKELLVDTPSQRKADVHQEV